MADLNSKGKVPVERERVIHNGRDVGQQSIETIQQKRCGDGVRVAGGWIGVSIFRHSLETSERDVVKATVGNCGRVQGLTIKILSDG